MRKSPLQPVEEINSLTTRFSSIYGNGQFGMSGCPSIIWNDWISSPIEKMNPHPIRDCMQQFRDALSQQTHSSHETENVESILAPLLLPMTVSVYHDVLAKRIDFRRALTGLRKEIGRICRFRGPNGFYVVPMPDIDFEEKMSSNENEKKAWLNSPVTTPDYCRAYTLFWPNSKNPNWELWVSYWGTRTLDPDALEHITPDASRETIREELEEWYNRYPTLVIAGEEYVCAWQCSDFLRTLLRYHRCSAEKPFFIYEWLFRVSEASAGKPRRITRSCYDFLCHVYLDGHLDKLIFSTALIGLLLTVATVVVFLYGAGLNIPLLSLSVLFSLAWIASLGVHGFARHILYTDYDNDSNQEAIPGFELFNREQLQALSKTADQLYADEDLLSSSTEILVFMLGVCLILLVTGIVVCCFSAVGLCNIILYCAAACCGMGLLAWLVMGFGCVIRGNSVLHTLQKMPPPFIEESAVPDNEPVRKAQVKFLWQMWNVHQGQGPNGEVLALPVPIGKAATV